MPPRSRPRGSRRERPVRDESPPLHPGGIRDRHPGTGLLRGDCLDADGQGEAKAGGDRSARAASSVARGEPGMMTRKRRRLMIVLLCGLGLGSATALALTAFQRQLVFFLTPRDAGQARARARARLSAWAGWCSRAACTGSWPAASFRPVPRHRRHCQRGGHLHRDPARPVPRGQGMVALGTMEPDGTFRRQRGAGQARRDLHAEGRGQALKASGHWNPSSGPPPPAATWNTLVPKTPAQEGG